MSILKTKYVDKGKTKAYNTTHRQQRKHIKEDLSMNEGSTDEAITMDVAQEKFEEFICGQSSANYKEQQAVTIAAMERLKEMLTDEQKYLLAAYEDEMGYEMYLAQQESFVAGYNSK